MARKPTATLVSRSQACTVWRIEYPGVPMRSAGPTYFAITYPGSDQMAIKTAAKRRPVAQGVALRIGDQVRQAIEVAKTQQRHTQ